MKTCMAAGAEIRLGFPATVTEQLDTREVEYLEGRELPDVPGLHLRQNSVGGYTFTTWATATVTVTISTNVPLPVTVVTPMPVMSGQVRNLPGQGSELATTILEVNKTDAVPTRPWMVTVSDTARRQPSYFGLFLWAVGLLVADYAHGY
jgi:hypothetical protein